MNIDDIIFKKKDGTSMDDYDKILEAMEHLDGTNSLWVKNFSKYGVDLEIYMDNEYDEDDFEEDYDGDFSVVNLYLYKDNKCLGEYRDVRNELAEVLENISEGAVWFPKYGMTLEGMRKTAEKSGIERTNDISDYNFKYNNDNKGKEPKKDKKEKTDIERD